MLPPRSTKFAFKCQIGTDLNTENMSNAIGKKIKQLFYIKDEDNIHLVCMRLEKAETRVFVRNVLARLESAHNAHFKKPEGSAAWVIFMGDELKEGQGGEIIQALKTERLANSLALTVSKCPGRHRNDMLVEATFIPMSPAADPPALVVIDPPMAADPPALVVIDPPMAADPPALAFIDLPASIQESRRLAELLNTILQGLQRLPPHLSPFFGMAEEVQTIVDRIMQQSA
jgi:hypothetical protein